LNNINILVDSAIDGHVRQNWIQSFLDEQFLLPETPFPPVSTGTRQDVIDAFFYNAGTVRIS